MSSLKKLTNKQKIDIWNKVDYEGLSYWVLNYGKEYENTEIGPLMKQARESLEKLQDLVEEFEEVVEQSESEEDET